MRERTIKATLVAIAAATAMVVASTGQAKPHGDHGHAGAHGRGGEHGGKGRHGGGPTADGGGARAAGGAPCDPAVVAAVKDAAATACPCAGVDDGAGGTSAWKNHGRYVRCVARAVREGLRAAGMKRRCLRDAVPCAARSSCGKAGAVACVVATTGTCVGGMCTNDPERACAADADCATTACTITSVAACTGLGGTGSEGSCCAASPSGAFLDLVVER
jgi:hypothetical protein